ncbi:MAG: hypothetical protein KJ558_13675 [Gammaproteobacteria bacterium]|nr:hypothetical protein [Gammaproteobacteria bacterium]MBU1655842.1 hypothetical protein [Gammaproteobacteria bacterium]MBU1961611.1 hypothetical protein [Gammaproteobacteria bacterium]
MRNILRYGTLNWGSARARDHIGRIKEQLWQLRLHPEMGLARGVLLPGIRSLAIEAM